MPPEKIRASQVAAVLWGFTVLLILAALLCCTTVGREFSVPFWPLRWMLAVNQGYKMGEQRAAYRHRELGPLHKPFMSFHYIV